MVRLQSSSPISIQAPLQWEGSVGVDRVQQGFSSHTSSFSSGRSGFLPPGCREAIGADVSWRGLSISTKRCWREKPSSFLPLNNPKTWHHRQKPKRGGEEEEERLRATERTYLPFSKHGSSVRCQSSRRLWSGSAFCFQKYPSYFRNLHNFFSLFPFARNLIKQWN